MSSFRHNESQEQDLLSISHEKDLTLDLQQAQERLLALRRQMEEAERLEQELETLKQRRDEVLIGQRGLIEKFARALAILERTEYEALREVEHIQLTRQSFNEHLQQLQAINPSDWQPNKMEEDLNRSMSLIDHANVVYNQARAKIDALSGRDFEGDNDSMKEDGSSASIDQETLLPFSEYVRRGFAYTLPLILFLALIFVVWLMHASSH